MTQQKKLHEAIFVLRRLTTELDSGSLKEVPMSRYKSMLTVTIKSVILLGALSEIIMTERDLLIRVERYQAIVDLKTKLLEGAQIKRSLSDIGRLVDEIGQMLDGTLDDIISLYTKENDGKEMGKL